MCANVGNKVQTVQWGNFWQIPKISIDSKSLMILETFIDFIFLTSLLFDRLDVPSKSCFQVPLFVFVFLLSLAKSLFLIRILSMGFSFWWPCCWLWWDGLGAYGCGVEGYVTYDGPGIGGFMNQVLVLVVLSSILMKKDLLRNHSNVGDDPHQLQFFFSFLHSKALKALGSAFVEAKGPSSPVQTLVGRYLQELLL
ncbi:hypothetical protein ACSQ67_017050 [Phaseolus vulgaris]